MIPSSTLSIKSNDIYYRCGNKSFSKSLLQTKKKKNIAKGKKVIQAKENISL